MMASPHTWEREKATQYLHTLMISQLPSYRIPG